MNLVMAGWNKGHKIGCFSYCRVLANNNDCWWRANANTLRSSALALCYSVAEYCCPVWQRSTHVSLVDAQLHSSMCLSSGTIRSTPLLWLPVLTNIEPPTLRCRAATDKLITQAECHRDWPLYDDVFHLLHFA